MKKITFIFQKELWIWIAVTASFKGIFKVLEAEGILSLGVIIPVVGLWIFISYKLVNQSVKKYNKQKETEL